MFTHNSGPNLIFGRLSPSFNENPDAGPNVDYQGGGVLDVRSPYKPGSNTSVFSFFDSAYIQMLDAKPVAKSNTNIANAVTPAASAVALTAGTGIVAASTVTNFFTGAVLSTTALAIGEAYTPLVVGRQKIFDPTKSGSRALRYVAGGAETGTCTTSGWDVFGQPVTETITLNGTNQVLGTKAFKYIGSVATTATATVSIGTTDTFGFPLRADAWEYLNVFMNNAYVTANTGFTAAVTTTPATALTGDVRGTYTSQTATDGNLRLAMYISIRPAQMLGNVPGLFTATATAPNWALMYGVTQF